MTIDVAYIDYVCACHFTLLQFARILLIIAIASSSFNDSALCAQALVH